MTAYVIATSCTKFGKHPGSSFKDLTRDAYLAVLKDAGLPDGGAIENAWFSNCGMGTFGQRNIRGQVCFTPLVREGLFPERVAMTNVEGGCASASMALHGAWKDILSGTADLSLAIGVEKTFVQNDPDKTREVFEGGIDQFDVDEWKAYYKAAGEVAGKPFDPNGGGGTVFMDTYAMQAAFHMAKYGTTRRQLATAASQSHHHGSLNPLAQYQFDVSVDQALEDRVVSDPLTRSMCAPIGDGAAAALVCSERFLAGLPPEIRERAVAIRAATMTGGKYRRLDEPSLSRVAAERAYRMAGLTPDAVDVTEVHDATSFSIIFQSEMMGFCPDGKGGDFVASGATALGGSKPVNLSGGLVSKGHPVGATGLSMIHELATQLRGEAGARQAEGARIALAENGGGTIGFDEAVCAVTILEKVH
ncbi:thiolase [Methylobacterium variabile]|jgi:acetyl-CoA acetyltransferase|uniref:propanoyl-CoA C-acyltransferase n=1 Tax=Methylobacterium variabile TaxID=298794 RepID=A0A0J6SM01_9HYPH|nr:thiolase family protein [Methylobacterium variabile]KMO36240.1 thiolase [Methylobacterium variabile]